MTIVARTLSGKSCPDADSFCAAPATSNPLRRAVAALLPVTLATLCIAACSGSEAATTPVVVAPSGVGAHALAYARFGSTVAQVSTAPITTQASGSTLIVSVGRGDVRGHRPPTDNRGNAFAQQGTAHTYTRYPGSGTALYVAQLINGGNNHIVATSHVTGDETTLAAVEVPGGSVT